MRVSRGVNGVGGHEQHSCVFPLCGNRTLLLLRVAHIQLEVVLLRLVECFHAWWGNLEVPPHI